MKLLLKNGVRINSADNEGKTALHIATGCFRIEEMKLLLQKRAAIDFVDNKGVTALQIAVSKGNLEAVKLLLENGAKGSPPINKTSEGWQTSSNCDSVSLLRRRTPSYLSTISETGPPPQTHNTQLALGASSSPLPLPLPPSPFPLPSLRHPIKNTTNKAFCQST